MRRVISTTIDLKANNYDELKLKQYDSTRLIFKLLDDSKPVDVTGVAASAVFKKPNDVIVLQKATADYNDGNGQVIIDLADEALLSYGLGSIEVRLEKSGELYSSFKINCRISKTATSEIKPDNTVNYLKTMQDDIDALNTKGNSLLTNIEKQSNDMKKQMQDTIDAINTALSNLSNQNGHIYGAERKVMDLNGNINTSPSCTRIYDAVGMVANATKDGSTVQNDFDNIKPWGGKDGMVRVNYNDTDGIVARYGDSNYSDNYSDGEVLVYTPTHWVNHLYPIKKSDGYYEQWCVADFEITGFVKIDEYLGGAYEMSEDDNGVHSRTNTIPLTNTKMTDLLAKAKAKGTNWTLMDWRRHDLQILYIVEYANLNSQAMLGNGVTFAGTAKILVNGTSTNEIIIDSQIPTGRVITVGSGWWNGNIAQKRRILSQTEYSANGVTGYKIKIDGEPITFTTSNLVWYYLAVSGYNDSLGMKSGCLLNDEKHAVNYRGYENLFSNIFELDPSKNIKNDQAYQCYDFNSYQLDKFDENYKKLGYVCPNDEGFITQMGYDQNHKLVSLPIRLQGNNYIGYADYYFGKNQGNRVALFGDCFNSRTNAGLFYWDFNHASSDSHWRLGARLLKIPE